MLRRILSLLGHNSMPASYVPCCDARARDNARFRATGDPRMSWHSHGCRFEYV